MKLQITLLFVLFSFLGISQEKKERIPSAFGFQVKPIFPGLFIGQTTKKIVVNGFETTIKQAVGYSFGGVVRANITKLIAIETGINMTERKFIIDSAYPDSNVFASAPLRYVTYDIPVSALFYIRLSEQFYMNASIGAAIIYNPTVAGVKRSPKSRHEFSQLALGRKVLAEAVANIGFEYRNQKAGTFYIGAAARVPFTPLFYLRSEYKYDGIKIVSDPEHDGPISGSYISLEFKYFFPYVKIKGSPIKTPIE